MNGKEAAAASNLRAIERARMTHPIRVGKIAEAYASGPGFIVTVDLGWKQVVASDGLSSVFLGELRAALATTGSLAVMVGRDVEVHLTNGQRANIAYTIGV